MIDLEKLEELAKAATPSPWEDVGAGRIRTSSKGHEFVADCAPTIIYGYKKLLKYKANAAYILAACNAVPELIARIRELEKKNERACDEINVLWGRWETALQNTRLLQEKIKCTK